MQNHTNKHFKLKHLGPTRSNIQQASSLLGRSHWQQEDPRGSWTTLKTGVTNSRTPALSQGPNVPHACMALDSLSAKEPNFIRSFNIFLGTCCSTACTRHTDPAAPRSDPSDKIVSRAFPLYPFPLPLTNRLSYTSKKTTALASSPLAVVHC